MDKQPHYTHDRPLYNIKAVSRLISLLPVTLRAWERRYGIPSPSRGDQGYRLYSEYDVRTLQWLKTQITSGLSISRAVEYLINLRSTGNDPAERNDAVIPQPAPVPITDLSKELTTALLRYDEPTALEILHHSLSHYPLDQALTSTIGPALIGIGESWHRGEIPIALEHYATQFCIQYLMSMLATSSPPTHPGTIVAACAPGEVHQLGLLMLVVILRWRGLDVKYLGPDLKLDRLEEALRPLSPRLLLFSATREENGERLIELVDQLSNFPHPQPIVVLGGQAFRNKHLPESLPAVYIDTTPSMAVAMIEELMK